MRGMYSQPSHSYIPTSPKISHVSPFPVRPTDASSPLLSPARSNKRRSDDISPLACSVPWIMISPPPLPLPTSDMVEFKPKYCGITLEPYEHVFTVINNRNFPLKMKKTEVDLPYLAPMTRSTRPTSFSRTAVTNTRGGYTPPVHWAKAKVVF